MTKEVLEPLLDNLVSTLPKPRRGEYVPGKTERLIRQFYESWKFQYGEKLLEWFLAIEDERSIRLAIELSNALLDSTNSQKPLFEGELSAFRGISRLVFKWLRKKDAAWYWSIPEFREYLMRHFVVPDTEEDVLPLYLTYNYDAGWPTLQRAVREVIAQRDFSMEETISHVGDIMKPDSISFLADPTDAREHLQKAERFWFLKNAAGLLGSWGQEAHRACMEVSMPGNVRVGVIFHTDDPDHNIAVGNAFTLKMRINIFSIEREMDEVWRTITSLVVPRLKLEGVLPETGNDAPECTISWNEFIYRADYGDYVCEVPLRLSSPVGRVRLSFVSVGREARNDSVFYVGDVQGHLNAAFLMRER